MSTNFSTHASDQTKNPEAPAGRCLIRRWCRYSVSIRTSFIRPDAPLLIDTSALRHSKCFASNAISSSFALPSTGGDFSLASHVPSSACSNELTREFGLTLTWMILGSTADLQDEQLSRTINTHRRLSKRNGRRGESRHRRQDLAASASGRASALRETVPLQPRVNTRSASQLADTC
jgi:hypothetical protein